MSARSGARSGQRPAKAVRPDGLIGIECALFRNEGPIRSSVLIREAVLLTWALWGDPGRDGVFTFIDPAHVVHGSNGIAGYCFRRAGWTRVGRSSDARLPRLRAPRPAAVPPWQTWPWHHNRGGLLRDRLERAPDLFDCCPDPPVLITES